MYCTLKLHHKFLLNDSRILCAQMQIDASKDGTISDADLTKVVFDSMAVTQINELRKNMHEIVSGMPTDITNRVLGLVALR